MIGINRGHLGYLCDLDNDSVFDALDSLLADDYSVEERMMLSGRIIHEDGHAGKEIQALNDYHREVYEKLLPYFEGEELAWLKQATRAVHLLNPCDFSVEKARG